ncbi:hypothetical protein [Mesorhizobium sp. M0217]|uniref:hypothetical protein n=1 Tax=unclassified Mesorhizobium TaxID=325217 RepID=UPI00333A3E2D
MLLALKARLAGFGLILREDKTRLIEFGRFASLSRTETFVWLHPLLRADQGLAGSS